MNGVVMVLIFLALLLVRLPIGTSMGLASVFYLVFLADISLVIQGQRMVQTFVSFPLLAVPLYILAANLMNQSKITNRIFSFAEKLVGFIPGGLGHVNIISSMIFAGMSGSAMADSAGLGRIEIKAMKEAGYPLPFSAAVTAASSTIGPIIPPSVMMIIYGMLAEESVAELFVAGAIPGFLMGVSLMILVYFMSRKSSYPRVPFPGLKSLGQSFLRALPPLMTPVIIMGGILGGVFTPTEAGVVAVVYAFLLGLFYRDLDFKEAFRVLKDSAVNTGVILWIFCNAAIFSWILTIENLPQLACDWLIGFTSETWVVLIILNVFLLMAGCILDPTPLLMIIAPIIIPTLVKFHIDPVHFGVVMVLNLLIGLLTPPVGLGLFVVSDIAKISFTDVCKAVLPFFIPLLIVLIMITYIPEITLFLPKLWMR